MRVERIQGTTQIYLYFSLTDEKFENTEAGTRRETEVRFYSIYDLIDLLGWSEPTVQKLFNDPKFPAVDYGKQKVVEKHALIRYFSERREKKYDSYWRN